jgi:polysaccharide pyruvyl transferase WcaK-like protein
MEQRHQRIALLHHTGGGNLGDDATMDIVLRSIRRRWPMAEIATLSMNPGEARKKYGVPSYPIKRYTWDVGYVTSPKSEASKTSKRGLSRRFAEANNPIIRLPRAILSELSFLVESFRVLRSFDLLIISGGGQLTERSGPWGFTYTLFCWVLMARAAGVKSVFLNVGAGPLKSPLGKFFARRALFAADYVSFRDEQSQVLANNIGFTGKSQVFPDNAYNIEPPPPRVLLGRRNQPIVGIAPISYPFCDPREHTSGHQIIYEELTAKLSKFAVSLVQRSYSFELFGNDIGADPAAIEDMRTVLRNRHNIITPEYVCVDSARELLSRMSAMDYVITCRFHGVVFAHLLNKPVLAISHHPKVSNLMNTLGLSQYCFDIEKFDPERLTGAFESMVRNSEEIKSSMAESLASFKAKLATQFDELFSPGRDTVRRLQVGPDQESGAEGAN